MKLERQAFVHAAAVLSLLTVSGNRQFISYHGNSISTQEGRNLVLNWKYKLNSNRESEEMSFGIWNPLGIISRKLLNVKATDKVSSQGRFTYKGLLSRNSGYINITLHNVTRHDENLYGIQIFLKMSAEGFSFLPLKDSFTLSVYALPRITHITKNMTVQEGSIVTLTCKARGHPKPTTTWYRHRNSMKQSENLSLNVGFDSQGMYVCKAVNRYGSDQRAVIITVKTVSKNITAKSPQLLIYIIILGVVTVAAALVIAMVTVKLCARQKRKRKVKSKRISSIQKSMKDEDESREQNDTDECDPTSFPVSLDVIEGVSHFRQFELPCIIHHSLTPAMISFGHTTERQPSLQHVGMSRDMTSSADEGENKIHLYEDIESMRSRVTHQAAVAENIQKRTRRLKPSDDPSKDVGRRSSEKTSTLISLCIDASDSVATCSGMAKGNSNSHSLTAKDISDNSGYWDKARMARKCLPQATPSEIESRIYSKLWGKQISTECEKISKDISDNSGYWDKAKMARMCSPQATPSEDESRIYSKLWGKQIVVECEIPPANVKLLMRIGSGSFGQVWKGSICGKAVAVKMLNADASPLDKKDLLSELEVMKSLKTHPNVVKLKGCITTSAVKCNGATFYPPMVFLELVPYGDLLGYLRKGRGEDDTYYNSREIKSPKVIDAKQLFSFSLDVARGMDFLSENKIVHRDLAARNVLVGDKLRCKITDFGMARVLNNQDIYTKRTNGLLPVKWMSLESLLYQKYTTKSDVWSFGVVLYEIFTLGGRPYADMRGIEVLEMIKSGKRLSKPPHICDKLYTLMLQCWSANPSRRPSFSSLSNIMAQLAKDTQKFVNLKEYNQHLYANISTLEPPTVDDL
ncbi:uncharacterized protein LOC110252540 isoform X3 [Exaiptasia diaphana]|uniref:receptor protein-tyrosine kinase n=1 Tax=Exaiptasia diaphana TaxID=2652724 RepID=A0A913Y6R4_EXADI|nr:uncharacterized protein LOC110252540 isoform X3 [Exaiptasia diaphana]